MWLIAGLGNPGSKYLLTRHNIGFLAMDYMVKTVGVREDEGKSEHKALTVSFKWDSESVKLAKPQTYMNLSGESVAALARFYKVPMEKVVIVYDELDLPFGQIRIKTNSGDGGHNGMKSIIEHFGTKEIMRIRVGIGRPLIAGMEAGDWVLQKFSKDEQNKLPEILERTVDALEAIVFEGPTAAMNKFN